MKSVYEVEEISVERGDSFREIRPLDFDFHCTLNPEAFLMSNPTKILVPGKKEVKGTILVSNLTCVKGR